MRIVVSETASESVFSKRQYAGFFSAVLLGNFNPSVVFFVQSIQVLLNLPCFGVRFFQVWPIQMSWCVLTEDFVF